MTKKLQSGKTKMMKGALLYLWEELKTMNQVKFKAMLTILSGYFRMKLRDQKRISPPKRREPLNSNVRGLS